MTTEAPSKDTLREFENSLDNATYAAIAHFEWMGLPDSGSDQRGDLLSALNDAIASVMREWV